MDSYVSLLEEIRDCTICSHHLPLGPRPVLQFHPAAKILIAGQAPGKKVHESGIPFDDASGDRLRHWMGISKKIFYDPEMIAILPMGFCYPGKSESGDKPPRPECAHAWRTKLLSRFINLQTTLVIGKYAINYHLKNKAQSLTETVRNREEYWPVYIPLPHPSPRNNIWLAKNRWFESELLAELQKHIKKILYE